MYKRFFLFCLVFVSLINFVSAVPSEPTDYNITLHIPQDNTDCWVLKECTQKGEYYINFTYIPYTDFTHCSLFTNESGSFAFEEINYNINAQVNNKLHHHVDSIPNTILWAVRCQEDGGAFHFSDNFTVTVTDAPYCAVLSETSCDSNAALGSEYIFKTRLGNTKGLWLENQDCNVWIENSDGVIVKKFNTMGVNQEANIQLDSDGNWINTASQNTILTDSQGYYVYPFIVASEWAYYGEEYTVKTVCNGQSTSCNFNVSKAKLPDVEHYEALGKEASGLLFILLCIFIVLFYLFKHGKRMI